MLLYTRYRNQVVFLFNDFVAHLLAGSGIASASSITLNLLKTAYAGHYVIPTKLE